jgi:large subunit ribosomal protein L23
MDKAMNPYIVIKRPLVTEKSTALSAAGKYIFEVDMRANKPQIKEAVQKAFDVTVTNVNVMVMKGKPRGSRRRGSSRRVTYGSDWKKAVVTLVPGDKIELFEGV